jgi:KEOPS complex subunit Cgi121
LTTEGIEIIGVRRGLEDPKATLADLQEFVRSRGGWAQLLDAGHVAGRDHILSAVEHARRAIDRGLGASGRFELEFLLYVSGERQISRAIEVAGVRRGRPFVAVVGAGPDSKEVLGRYDWEADASVIDSSPAKIRALGFSTAEIEAAGERAADLVLEKVARVDLLK